MNATVATLTRRSLLGRKRTLVLLLLPLALIGLCTLARVLAGLDADIDRELETTLAPNFLTAFGIAISIPALIFYRHFKNKVDTYVVEMELRASKLVDILHGERLDFPAQPGR